MQVHTLKINPDNGEVTIEIVGAKTPLSTTLPTDVLQSVLSVVGVELMKTMLPKLRSQPAPFQGPQKRTERWSPDVPGAVRIPIEDPDDDPTPDEIGEIVGFTFVADEIESTLAGLFDEDTDIVVTPVLDGDGGHVVVAINSPDGTRKGGTFTYADWVRDQCSVRPFLSVITGRSL